MSIPLNRFSSTPVPGDFFPPDDRVRPSRLVDYELGGIGIGDASQGLQVQVWEAQVSGNDIQIRPEGIAAAWTTVTSDTNITEVALAFDQNMRPTIAYVANGESKMYWFDSDIGVGAYTTTTFPNVTSPRVTMDDKRPSQIAVNDILLFYISAGQVAYRQQRDRFLVERTVGVVPDIPNPYISRWGMTSKMRIQLDFKGGTGAPSEGDAAAAHTVLLTDTLYVTDGVNIVPLFESATPLQSTWRSPRIRYSDYPAFSWLRVLGDFAHSVVVNLYGDGVLWCSLDVTSKEPVRLPPGRFRSMEVEVVSLGEVPAVALASSASELKAIKGAS